MRIRAQHTLCRTGRPDLTLYVIREILAGERDELTYVPAQAHGRAGSVEGVFAASGLLRELTVLQTLGVKVRTPGAKVALVYPTGQKAWVDLDHERERKGVKRPDCEALASQGAQDGHPAQRARPDLAGTDELED
jgi:hypothetical protein